MRFRLSLCVPVFIACSAALAQTTHPSGRPFSGLTLRDDDTGVVLVAHIAPGPLEGKGFRSPHLERGDTILSINGEPMTAKAFEELVARSKVGDEIVMQVKRTGSPETTAVPTAAAEGKIEELKFRLAEASEWSGPVGFPNARALNDAVAAIDASPAPTALEAFIDAQVAVQQLTEPTAKLCDMLTETQRKAWGANALSHVAYGFVYPKRMLRLQESITKPLPAVAGDPRQVLVHMATLLDVAPQAVSEPLDLNDPAAVMDILSAQLDLAAADVERAFEGMDPAQRAKQAEQIESLMRHVATPKTVESAPRVKEFIEAMQATMSIDYPALFTGAGRLAGVLSVTLPATLPSTQPATTLPSVPDELEGAVGGPIVAARRSASGWIVIGGAQANIYDLSKLAAVIDLGGDDTYSFPEGTRPRVQVIVDQAGNDNYISAGNGLGPASAVMGVSVINDCAGDDLYKGNTIACGAGVMGIGILLDRAGNDRYEASAWSEGAGVYGAGAIIDLAGSDTYIASIDSQAIGGPRGVGIILDADGADVYRANGPIPSAYGTPAVAYAMSQGVGLGFRRFDTGGIGILEDLAGNDRYEGGEFSQGGGYYYGLGLLHDRSGSDVYFGNRYSQAFAAHTALGMLVDDAGDDSYWAMTAANQSGSWDKCVTVLLDRAGNDTYHGDGLSQGSASMQAIAWLIDLDGTDHYVGAGTATQGQSGGNTYSYRATGAFSWSLLLDTGGAKDFYSSGRGDSQALVTGALNETQREASDLSGLFIDTNEKLVAP
jgi:hypothetical protein